MNTAFLESECSCIQRKKT